MDKRLNRIDLFGNLSAQLSFWPSSCPDARTLRCSGYESHGVYNRSDKMTRRNDAELWLLRQLS